MHPTARCTPTCLALAAIVFASLSGCASVAEKADGQKVIVDGDKYVTYDPAVGSHMKRRVKLSEASQPGISPTRKDIVTAETDTTILPTTAGEMERTISDRPTN
jgi:hypothetical protein